MKAIPFFCKYSARKFAQSLEKLRRTCAQLRQTSGGFSLIELSVTVGILLVLAALLFPAFQKSLDAANTGKCIGNLKQMGQAIALYANDNNGTLPPSEDGTFDTGGNWIPSGSFLKNWWGWPYRYHYAVAEGTGYSYLPPLTLFACPGDRMPLTNRLKIYTSYAFNPYFFVSYGDGKPMPYNRNTTGRYIRMAEAAKKILIVDANTTDPLYGAQGALVSDRAVETVSTRHHGGANALFGNGSVQWTTGQQIYDAEGAYTSRDMN